MIDPALFGFFLAGALVLNLTPGPDMAFTLASATRGGSGGVQTQVVALNDVVVSAVDPDAVGIRARIGVARDHVARRRAGAADRVAVAEDGQAVAAIGQRRVAVLARALWIEALRHDSTFAWAHVSLADDAVGRNDQESASRHYRAALASPARLAPVERARVTSALSLLAPPP